MRLKETHLLLSKCRHLIFDLTPAPAAFDETEGRETWNMGGQFRAHASVIPLMYNFFSETDAIIQREAQGDSSFVVQVPPSHLRSDPLHREVAVTSLS